MAQLLHFKGMTQSQVELLEAALRQVTRISPPGWDSIPAELHPFFLKYMSRDVWTGESDPLTLQDAALRIVLDAITISAEFAGDDT